MKICYVANNLTIHDQRFFEKFIEKGWEVHVVHLGRHSSRKIEISDKITFYSFISKKSDYFLTNFHRSGWPVIFLFEFLKSFYNLRKLLNNIKPDVVHAGWVDSAGFISALTKYHPFLLMPWGSDILINPERSLISRFITKYSISCADMITCDAEYVKKRIIELTNYPDEKIVVFPRGIDLKKFKPAKFGYQIRERLGWEDKKIIIMTRTFSSDYGIGYFLRSIDRIKNNIPKARIILCGEGPLGSEFRNFVKDKKLTEFVHFAGYVNNNEIPRYFAAADIYVSSSLSDGTSISLLEAMACGLPVVVTDIPTNREWIIDGINGFLVPKKDPKKLSDKIIELLENISLMEKFSERNYQIAKKKADWDKNFAKLEKIYKKLKDNRICQSYI